MIFDKETLAFIFVMAVGAIAMNAAIYSIPNMLWLTCYNPGKVGGPVEHAKAGSPSCS
jgi:hypothetical protein